MRIQLQTSAGLFALLANVALAAASGPGSRPRVAVVNAVEFPANIPEVRAKLRDTLTSAVKQHGYELTADEGTCVDRECLKVLASQAGATDVLIAVGGQNAMHGYHVELRIWNVSSDRDDRSTAECNVCTGDQIVDTVSGSVGQLLDRIPVLHASVVSPVVPPVVPTPPAPPPAMAPTVIAGPTGPVAPSVEHRTWPLWTMGAGGAALVAGLAVGIFVGERSGCSNASASECFVTYDYRPLGYVIAGVGAVAAATGAYFLLTEPLGGTNRKVSVALSPAGFGIGGQF